MLFGKLKVLALVAVALVLSACATPTSAIKGIALAPMPTAEPYLSITQIQGGTTTVLKSQTAVAADLRMQAVKELGGIGQKEAETKGLLYPYSMYGTGLPQAAPGHFRGPGPAPLCRTAGCP